MFDHLRYVSWLFVRFKNGDGARKFLILDVDWEDKNPEQLIFLVNQIGQIDECISD